jgi:hypothetical protein
MTPVPERRESKMREQASLVKVGLQCCPICEPLSEHHLAEFAWKNSPQRAHKLSKKLNKR